MVKKNNKKINMLSILFTMLIVGFLVIAGPASAVTLSVSPSNPNPYERSLVTFTVAVDIDSGERIPVDNLKVIIKNADGSENESCEFNVDGTKNTCSGNFGVITPSGSNVAATNGPLSGYGYGNDGSTYSMKNTNFGTGYGYGYANLVSNELSYTFQWTTPVVNSNTNFKVSFEAYTDGSFTYMTQSDSVITVRKSNSGGGSSPINTTETTNTTEPTPEITPDTTTDDSSSNTGGGSEGGIITVETPEVETPEVETPVEVPVEPVVTTLNTIEVPEVVNDVLTVDDVEERLSSSAPEAVEVVKKALENKESVKSQSKSRVELQEVSNADGSKVKQTKISKEIKVEIKEGMETIEVIEVIPKEVVASASLIKGNFRVLQDDPVIAFDVPVSEIVDGNAKIEYTIEGDSTSNANTITTMVNSDTSSSNVGIIFLILLLVVAIGGALYFIFKKKE